LNSIKNIPLSWGKKVVLDTVVQEIKICSITG